MTDQRKVIVVERESAPATNDRSKRFRWVASLGIAALIVVAVITFSRGGESDRLAELERSFSTLVSIPDGYHLENCERDARERDSYRCHISRDGSSKVAVDYIIEDRDGLFEVIDVRPRENGEPDPDPRQPESDRPII